MTRSAPTSAAVRRLGHVVLKARDLARSRAFYEQLGLEFAAQLGEQMLFLRAGNDHHTIAFLNVGANAPSPARQAVGLLHIAFQVDSKDELLRMYRRLRDANVQFSGFSDHVVSHSMYLNDPDGNEVEIYADQPRERWQDIAESLTTRPWDPESELR